MKNPLGNSFLVATVILLGLMAVMIVTNSGYPFQAGRDPYWYRTMAERGLSTVHKPYANRILYPYLAGALSRSTRVPLPAILFALGTVSIAGLALTLMVLNAGVGVSPYVTLAVCASPVAVLFWRGFYLPDIFYAFLTAVFFLLLARSERIAIALIPVLYLTRESTILLCAVVIVIAWREHRMRLLRDTALMTVLAVAASAFLTRHALPDIHGLGTASYSLLKVMVNFLRSWCGVLPYSNTLASVSGYCHVPAYSILLPKWVPAGSIKKIGICGINPLEPLQTLATLATTFGTLPVILYRNRARLTALTTSGIYLKTALLYGLITFAIGPLLGAAVPRLVAYGWPAFWIAACALLSRPLPARHLGLLLLMYWTVCWAPFAADWANLPAVGAICVGLGVAAVGYWGTIRLLPANDFRKLTTEDTEEKRSGECFETSQ